MDLDHREMAPPFLREQSRVTGASDTVIVWDLRIAMPNVSALAGEVLHSLEHMLAVYLRRRNRAVVNVAPLGCRTGLYIVTIGPMAPEDMCALLAATLDDIHGAYEVPLANTTECGAAAYHSLTGAQDVARWLLSRRTEWTQASRLPA